MLSTKTRATIIALVASAGLAVAVAPAVSQAQWHTICLWWSVTHTPTSPKAASARAPASAAARLRPKTSSATTTTGSSSKAQQGGTENATKELETNEAVVSAHAEQEAFEYGCDIAPA